MDEKQRKILVQQAKALGQLHKSVMKRDAEVKKNGEASEKTAKLVDAQGKTLGEIQKTLDEMLANDQRLGAGGEVRKSAGELFIESDIVTKSSPDSINRGQAVPVKSFHKDMTSGTTGNGNGGLLVQPQRNGNWVDEIEKTLAIRDLLTIAPTTSNAVEFVRVLGMVNNAAYRPEGTAAAQSELSFDLKTAMVKNIAHWMPASREILNDVPALRAFIDNKLIYGIKAKEDAELLYGTGVSNNITGLMVDADVQVFDRYGAGDTKIDILRRALTDVAMTEYSSTGIIMNPMDFEDIELMKGSDAHYIWLSIPSPAGPQMFRLPIVEAKAMVQGDFLTGAFRQGATLYDREQASIRFSESHEDFFTKGMVAILAEERLALAIERPQAFVRGKFTDPTPG